MKDPNARIRRIERLLVKLEHAWTGQVKAIRLELDLLSLALVQELKIPGERMEHYRRQVIVMHTQLDAAAALTECLRPLAAVLKTPFLHSASAEPPAAPEAAGALLPPPGFPPEEATA